MVLFLNVTSWYKYLFPKSLAGSHGRGLSFLSVVKMNMDELHQLNGELLLQIQSKKSLSFVRRIRLNRPNNKRLLYVYSFQMYHCFVVSVMYCG
jgi:hypothetical protein